MFAFFIGLAISILGLVMSFFIVDTTLIYSVFLFIGFGSILLSAISSGSMTSGERIGANYSDPEDYGQRINWSLKFFLFGIPFILALILLYLLSKGFSLSIGP